MKSKIITLFFLSPILTLKIYAMAPANSPQPEHKAIRKIQSLEKEKLDLATNERMPKSPPHKNNNHNAIKNKSYSN